MSYLIGCCAKNNNGDETYYLNGRYICGECGHSIEDDGEEPEDEGTYDGGKPLPVNRSGIITDEEIRQFEASK